MQQWKSSQGFRDVQRFITEMCEEVVGHKLTDDVPKSPAIRCICDIFHEASSWIDDIPPATHEMRYGNPAFKQWHAKMCERTPALMRKLLEAAIDEGAEGAAVATSLSSPLSFTESSLSSRVEYEASLRLPRAERLALESAAAARAVAAHASAPRRTQLAAPTAAAGEGDTRALELGAYFAESFGNATRIDYGTGHELAFVVWLRCLDRSGVLAVSDRSAVALVVVEKYLQLMRRLQTTYYLEPAGSHGVWGLDDYQFLPFILGAAQLSQQQTIQPSAILDNELLAVQGDAYYYLAAIRFVKSVKRGHFGEHSPMLNDISQLESWHRVAAGLMRMYEGEVLGKLVVVQHLPFGRLFPWEG